MTRIRGGAARKRRIDYTVGYGRPPLPTRFKRGQSGNPKGRPKGTRNTETMARDALERTVIIEGNGIQQRKTVREVAFQSIAEKAASGDIKSLDFLLAFEKEGGQFGSDLPEQTSSEQALEIVKAFLDRQRVAKGDKK